MKGDTRVPYLASVILVALVRKKLQFCTYLRANISDLPGCCNYSQRDEWNANVQLGRKLISFGVKKKSAYNCFSFHYTVTSTPEIPQFISQLTKQLFNNTMLIIRCASARISSIRIRQIINSSGERPKMKKKRNAVSKDGLCQSSCIFLFPSTLPITLHNGSSAIRVALPP